MNRLLIAASIHLDPLLQRARPIVCLSRILLCVVALELLTMPVTQGLWTWDKFLHGGQDFELGLLVIVTCLCLLLLRAEQSKLYIGMLVLIRAFLLFLPQARCQSPERLPLDFCSSSGRPAPNTRHLSPPADLIPRSAPGPFR